MEKLSSNVTSEWICGEFRQELPVFHIVVPGQQLCFQAREYILSWKSLGYIQEPKLGSAFPHLLINHYSHSHRILITYIEDNIPLEDINKKCQQYVLSFDALSFFDIGKVVAVWVICSHFIPIQAVISYYRQKRKQIANLSNVKIIELQHGWVTGKNSALRSIDKTICNPDIYLTFDSNSSVYLKNKYPSIMIAQIGDILFSSQILHSFHQSPKLKHSEKPKNVCNLLVCFSEKDLKLNYIAQDYSIVNGKAIPKEILEFIKFLKANHKALNIKFRSKPHQVRSTPLPGFHSVLEQDSLADDVIWADHICSALSAVSVSSSLLNIPSYFYISKYLPLHNVALSSYSKSIFHLGAKWSQNTLNGYLSRKENWLNADLSKRKQLCLVYSRKILSKFYRLADQFT